jgi:ketosteroid isomerase-like protein
MSQENVELLRRALESPDPEALFAILDANVEWDFVGAFPEATTHYGPDGVREFLGQWAGAFDDFGFEADDVIEAGDFALVSLHQWGRGKETGAQVDSRTWQVFAFRVGKVISCHGYATKAEALEAAGVSE